MKISILYGLGKSAKSTGHGMHSLGLALRARGFDVELLKWNGKITGHPDVLIGHSFGGAACMKWLAKHPSVTVSQLFLIDAVPNFWWLWPFVLIGKWKTPRNVKFATAFKQSSQPLPPSRAFSDGSGQNIHVRDVSHDGIANSAAVHKQIIDMIDEQAAFAAQFDK